MIAKKQGLPFNNLEALRECKEHFLSLCVMYDHMGKLFQVHAKELSHPQFSRTSLPQTHQRILDQFHEIGEEMKNVGTILDLMGGNPVMKPEEPEKEEPKKEVYVDNIAPEKESRKE